MNYTYQETIELIKEIAIRAGEKVLKIYYDEFKVEYKADNSPLTCADKAADEIIVKAIKEYFPDHGILSEESSDDLTRIDKEYCWSIDPIDGTREFVNHTDEFSINIALVKNKRPVLGVVYIPVTKDMYFAYKGGGSYHSIDGEITKNEVSKKVDDIKLLSSKHHKSKEFLNLLDKNADRIGEVVGVGSSLKGCLIARGKAEGYFRYGLTSEWDTAAMEIIVEEAGGIFKQLDDTIMYYNRKDTLNRKGFYIINKIENKLVL